MCNCNTKEDVTSCANVPQVNSDQRFEDDTGLQKAAVTTMVSIQGQLL